MAKGCDICEWPVERPNVTWTGQGVCDLCMALEKMNDAKDHYLREYQKRASPSVPGEKP